MRPLAVEFLHERIEAGLLLQAVHAWWPRGFVLERQVHALVAAILLRVAGPNALDVGSEAQPPYGKPGEIEQGVRAGEGDAVVRADGGGQAALAEELLEGGDGGVFAGRLERFAQQQEARRA